jgi:tetratricopeptide (TPR) repeat protein
MYSGPRENYQAWILEEANAICDGRPAGDLAAPSFMHLRGLLARRQRKYDFAIACLTRAAELDARNSSVLGDLGETLSTTGRHSQALDVLRSALLFAPHEALLQGQVGRALLRAGRSHEAVRMFQDALRADPADVELHADCGDAYHSVGDQANAEVCYQHAIQLDGSRADLYCRLGHARLQRNQLTLAAEAFREGLARDGRSADLHAGLGETMLRFGALGGSLNSLRSALEIEPTNVRVCQLFVYALELLGRRADAVDAWCVLGAALRAHGQLEEAAAAYQQALARKPSNLRALFGLGAIYVELARPLEAIKYLEAVLGSEPEHAAAHQLIGWAFAAIGDLQRNWDEIAWFDAHGPWKRFEQPHWDGRPLHGKTILLWINAGLGDTIQHLRFVPQVKALAGHVVVECDRVLVPIVQRMACVDDVVAKQTPLPNFDVHALFASLPRIFQVGLASVPNEVPYVTIESSHIEKWRARISQWPEMKVGLVWGSRSIGWDAGLKSLPLASFAPLAGVPSVRFVSLQLGPQAAELTAPPRGLAIERVLDDAATIVDTSAIIMSLDLVITIDTMIAHLAGALGRPVWTLLRYAADWRWLLDGETSPWYPTMRLFRQTRRGDWSGVLERVRAELTDQLD